MSKAVVVLGMHRSGTSAMAGVLQALGVNMGDRLYGADRGNPHGHFEDVDFLELNTAILRAAGGEWHNPPSDFQVRIFGASEGERLISLVELRNREHALWGFKDPRTCLTLPLYMPHLPGAYFVVMRRNCEEVARSLHERDGDSFHFEHDNVQLCREYTRRLRSTLDEFRPAKLLQVDFEELLREPGSTVARVRNFIGLSADKAALAAAAALIRKKQRPGRAAG